MKCILVVDDETTTLDMMKEFLTRIGYEVFLAHDALIALQIIEHEKIDLVLLDIRLPGVDGLTLSRMLRGNPETAFIKIIAFSGYIPAGADPKVWAPDCDACLSKPLENWTVLEQTIAQLIHDGQTT